jgi:hypothetical protein
MRQLAVVVTVPTKIAVALRTLEDGAGLSTRLARRARLSEGFVLGFVLDQSEGFARDRSEGFVLERSEVFVLERSEGFVLE